jgi:predicted nucleotide-binding protein
MTARDKRRERGDSDSIDTRLLVPIHQLQQEIDDQIGKGELLRKQPIPVGGIRQLRNDYYTWDEYNRELLRKRFSTSEVAREYAAGHGVVFVGPMSDSQRYKEVHEDLRSSIRLLHSIRARLVLFDEPEASADVSPREARDESREVGKTLFVVHGHDEEVKQRAARFLEKLTALDVVILHEKANEGRTIIEKFEDHASEAAFAVILLTGDDVGGEKQAEASPDLRLRARQNVVLELGFFIGALGRSKVAVLYQAGVELPSDMSGVLYTELDSPGAWRTELARELRAAGIEVNPEVLL